MNGTGSRLPVLGARCAVAGTVGAALVLLALAGAAPRAQQQVPPRRIISVIPAVTEILFAIGAGPQVVGVGSFDRFPPQVENLPRVGALIDPDLERMLTLRPDLVALYGSQQDQREQLTRAHIPVFTYRHGGLRDVTALVDELGRITGHTEEATRLIASIARGLADIEARVQGRPRPLTMLVLGREPDALRNVYANGGVGFLHDMMEVAGADNIFADVMREAVQPTSETILATGADVIIELRADGAVTAEDLAGGLGVWNRLSTLQAVRSGRVHALIGSEIVVPGPRVVEGTRRLAALIHPDAF
jgi:iron complex transport system substrate-binding protein